MVGLDHGRPDDVRHDDEVTAARNSRYGLILFAIYLALYGGFVLINTFAPRQMERVVGAGLNLAVVYGFGLIVAALVLSLVYGWLCRASAPTGKESRK